MGGILMQPYGAALVALVGSIFHSRVYRDPVHLPDLAPIVRECLLKSARVGSNVRNNESNKDSSAIKHLLVIKLAAPIFKGADCGLAQTTALAVGEIKTPLPGLGIIKAQA